MVVPLVQLRYAREDLRHLRLGERDHVVPKVGVADVASKLGGNIVQSHPLESIGVLRGHERRRAVDPEAPGNAGEAQDVVVVQLVAVAEHELQGTPRVASQDVVPQRTGGVVVVRTADARHLLVAAVRGPYPRLAARLEPEGPLRATTRSIRAKCGRKTISYLHCVTLSPSGRPAAQGEA